MAEDASVPHMPTGIPYPKDYVVAAIDDRDEAERAAEALRQVGFDADDIVLLHSDQVLTNLQVKERHRNVVERTIASLQTALSDEGMDAKRYETEARRGASILHVYAPEPAQVHRAQEILRAYHAHHMKHYGDWTVEDLTPSVGE